jgi:hypothetical protein
MIERELRAVEENLRKALQVLDDIGIADKEIAQKYAVYFVALKLAEKGHEVLVPGEKGRKGRADLQLPEKKMMIEVKSGRRLGRRLQRRSGASFGQGKQIKQKEFGYCVFLTFEGNKIDEIFVFSLKELNEAQKPREGLASYGGTNSCIVFRFDNLEEGKKWVRNRKHPEKLLNIEIELYQHPEKFRDRWDKILI